MEHSFVLRISLGGLILLLGLGACQSPSSPQSSNSGTSTGTPTTPTTPTTPAQPTTALVVSSGGTALASGATLWFPNMNWMSGAYQVLDLKNSGTTTINVKLSLADQPTSVPANYSLTTQSTSTKYPIKAGESLSVKVKIQPTTYATLKGQFTVTTDEASAPSISVNLATNASSTEQNLVATLGGKDYPVSNAGNLNLGNAWINKDTVDMPVQIRNTGYKALTLSSITLTGDSSVTMTAGTVPVVLQDQAAVTVSLRFAPTTHGTKTASLKLAQSSGSYLTLSFVGEAQWYPLVKHTLPGGQTVYGLNSWGTTLLPLLSSSGLGTYSNDTFVQLTSGGTRIGSVVRSMVWNSALVFPANGSLLSFGTAGLTTLASGYYDFASAKAATNGIFFIDDKSSGSSTNVLYYYNGSAVSLPSAGTTGARWPESIVGVLGDTALVTSSEGISYLATPMAYTKPTVASGSDFKNAYGASVVFDGKLYFVGYNTASTSVQKWYVLEGTTVKSIPAVENQGLVKDATIGFVNDKKLYLFGSSASGAVGVSLDASGLVSSVAIPANYRARADVSPLAYGTKTVFGIVNSAAELSPAVLDNGTITAIPSSTGKSITGFSSPLVHKDKLYFAGRDSVNLVAIQWDGTTTMPLYAGTSGYSSGFNYPQSVGDLLYFSDSMGALYSFGY